MFVFVMGVTLPYQLAKVHLDQNIATFCSEIFVNLCIDKNLQTLFF